MVIEVVCPACNRQIKTKAEYVGKRAKCKCGHVFVIEEAALEPELVEAPETPVEEAPPPPLPVQPPSQAAPMAGIWGQVKFDWKNWDLGGKAIFISACVAAGSMLISWVDIGIARANGISQGTFLFLGVFVYPLWMVLTSRSLHLQGGIACGALGILCAIGYIGSRQFDFFGSSVNVASNGPYLFLLSCGGLIFGVVKYRPNDGGGGSGHRST